MRLLYILLSLAVIIVNVNCAFPQTTQSPKIIFPEEDVSETNTQIPPEVITVPINSSDVDADISAVEDLLRTKNGSEVEPVASAGSDGRNVSGIGGRNVFGGGQYFPYAGGCSAPNNENGECVSVKQCPGVYGIRDANFLFQYFCGYQEQAPQICCPSRWRQRGYYSQSPYQRPSSGFPPIKTGYPPTNTGYPPINTGYPPINTGYSPINAGNPPLNTGYPPINTGYPPLNTGNLPINPCYTPINTGYPPINAGYPPRNTGNPPINTGYPPINTGYPPINAGNPQINSGYSSKSQYPQTSYGYKKYYKPYPQTNFGNNQRPNHQQPSYSAYPSNPSQQQDHRPAPPHPTTQPIPRPAASPTVSVTPEGDEARARKPAIIPDNCGRSDEGRIVGGNDTIPGAWPWMAAVLFERYGGFEQECGGALVSNKHVITAAHCLVNQDPNKLRIRLGDHDLSRNDELPTGTTITVKVSKITSHTGFSRTTFKNDIAILHLAEEVPFSLYIAPVCLPYDAVYGTLAGDEAIVTGWGRTSFTSRADSSVLRQARIRIWSEAECKDAFSKEVAITSEYLCAGDGDGKTDSCQGDSGGPLVYEDGIKYYLVGVVSFGKKCATPGYPGAYTRVTKYLQWLNDHF